MWDTKIKGRSVDVVIHSCMTVVFSLSLTSLKSASTPPLCMKW